MNRKSSMLQLVRDYLAHRRGLGLALRSAGQFLIQFARYADQAGHRGPLTTELARLIRPRHVEVMRGLGHFPMSENPAVFLGYLRPVLEGIAREDWCERER